jgi:hypothetical protein
MVEHKFKKLTMITKRERMEYIISILIPIDGSKAS